MDKKVIAKSKYVRRTPRKLRLIVDMIRGKKADEALSILKFSPKDGAHDVYKTVHSAISNAVFNHSMDKKLLTIVEAYVNEAPTFKRGQAVSRGRYHEILKRNSHIIITVSDNSPVVKQTKNDTAQKVKKAESTKKETKKVTVKKTVEKKPKVANKSKINNK